MQKNRVTQQPDGVRLKVTSPSFYLWLFGPQSNFNPYSDIVGRNIHTHICYINLLTAKLPLCLVWTAISHAWWWFLSDRVLRYLRIVSSCWLVRIPLNPIRYPSSPHEIPMKSQWNHHSIPFNPLKFPVDPTLNHMKSWNLCTTSSVWPLSRSGACSCGRGRWWLFHLNITPVLNGTLR